MAHAARPQFPCLAPDFEAGASSMDEVELVLLLVEVRAGDHSRSEDERVDTERRDSELAAHFPEDAFSHLVDRSECVAHGYHRYGCAA